MILDYYKHSAVSNSSLKYLNPAENGSPEKFRAHRQGLMRKNSKALRIGGMIHALLLEPHNTTLINGLPSDKIIEIVDSVYAHIVATGQCDVTTTQLADLKELVIDYARQLEYQKNWKDDTVFEKIVQYGSTYFRILCDNGGDTGSEDDDESVIFLDNKIVVTPEATNIANTLSQRIAMDPELQQVFFGSIPGYERQIERGFVFDFVVEEAPTPFIPAKTIPFKTKTDLRLVNHDRKHILHYDLKTSRDHPASYERNIFNYRIFRQLAGYDLSMKKEFGSDYIIDHHIVTLHTAELNEVSVIPVGEEFIALGLEELNALMKLAHRIETTGKWNTVRKPARFYPWQITQFEDNLAQIALL